MTALYGSHPSSPLTALPLSALPSHLSLALPLPSLPLPLLAPPPPCPPFSGGKATATEHQPARSEDGGGGEAGGDSRIDGRLQWGRHHQCVQVSVKMCCTAVVRAYPT